MSAQPSKVRDGMVVLSAGLLAGMLRFGDLGRQSPWLDELTNWQLAVEQGTGWGRAGHWLTGWCQSAGLAVWDSEAGLRLYSAVFGTLAVVLGTWWMLRRCGLVCGVATGLMLALSPFGIFYSQDANHYAPMLLGGVAAVVLFDGLLARRWLAAMVGAACVVLTLGFHPTGVFLCGMLIIAPLVFAFVRTSPEDFDRAKRKRIRMVAVFAATLVVAVVGYFGLRESGKLWASQPGGRQFGLNWDFVSATLASFHGAIYRFGLPDVALGIAGAVLGIAGIVFASCRAEWRWVAIGIAATILCVVGPFMVIGTRQYFSPRYLAAASPPALMAIALGFAGVGGRARVLRIAAAIWILLFVARATMWEAARFGGSFQPTRDAVAWLGNHMTGDAKVLTRHAYSSLGVRFLWRRQELPSGSLIALTSIHRRGSISIQQVREVLQGTSGAVYFVSLIEQEEMQARDFAAWLKTNSTVVAHFPSTATDAFVPIDWGITIRQLHRDGLDATALPRDGASASNVFPDSQINVEGSRIIMREGNVVAYNFSTAGELDGIRIEAKTCSVPYPFPVIAQIDDTPPWVFSISEQASGPRSLLVRQDVPKGTHTITISCPMDYRMKAAGWPYARKKAGMISGDLLEIVRVGKHAGESPDFVGRATVLGGESGAIAAPASLVSGYQQGQTITLDSAAQKESLVAVRKYHVTGIGNVGVRDEVELNSGVLPMWRAVDWTYAPINMTCILTPVGADSMAIRLSCVRLDHFHPRGLTAEFGAMRAYRFADAGP
ncbi:hypothetical protein IT570_04710 [Candidatus Sumerlaeota bacterium]|nr:hypothetical protein [Candidatus Sumerlaeota bacterium]